MRSVISFLVVLLSVTLLTACGSGGATVNSVPTITSVSVTCAPSAIVANQTSSCTTTLQGTGNFNNAVTWGASMGSITAVGVFTPPGVTTTTTVTVTATSAQ